MEVTIYSEVPYLEVNIFVYTKDDLTVKTKEFRRYLASLGAEFAEGTKHTKVYLIGKQTTLPRHADELDPTLQALIRRQLGIKERSK